LVLVSVQHSKPVIQNVSAIMTIILLHSTPDAGYFFYQTVDDIFSMTHMYSANVLKINTVSSTEKNSSHAVVLITREKIWQTFLG
jgi:hypothetical protein